MIFKTFNSDIDIISSKWGIFGNSFNDIGTAIIRRITDINKAFQVTYNLVGSFKDSDSIRKRLYPSKESIKEQLIDVDSMIPKINKETFDFDHWINEINDIDKQVKGGTKSWQDYSNGLKDNQKWIAKWGQETEGQIRTQSDLIKANQQARASALAHNEAIKTQTFSAKAGKVALQGLAIAGNVLAMWAISKGVELTVKGIDELTHSTEHCKERVDELMSSYQSAIDKANSNAKTIEELASRYKELSNGVNNLGENVSLTTDEYSEYNKIVNQIAGMFPTLVQGYTNEGTAILSLKGNVEQLRDAYKGAQQEAYNLLIFSGEASDGNDIIKNWYNISEKNDFSIIAHTSEAEARDALQRLYELANSGSVDLFKNSFNAYEKQFAGSFSKISNAIDKSNWINLTEEDLKSMIPSIQSYIQTYQAEINSALKNVQALANAYLMTNEDYAKLDDQSKNAVSIIVNSINEGIANGFDNKEDVGEYVTGIVDTIKDNPEVQNALIGLFSLDLTDKPVNEAKELINFYVKSIAEAIGEDELELRFRLGFDDIVNTANRLRDSIRRLTDDHGVTDREEYTRLIETIDFQSFTQAQTELWLETTRGAENATQAIEMYEAKLAEVIEPEKDAKQNVPTISSSVQQLAAQLEPQFARLGEAYRAIFAEDGFSRDAIDNSMLEGLRQSFAEIEEEAGVSFDPDELESFFAILTDGRSEAEQVQTAFNDLATAYFRSTEILGQFNRETAEAIEKQLEEMGVTNAHEVALHALSEAKFRNVIAGYDLADASNETMVSILNEGRAAGVTEQMIYALTAAEIAFGNNELSIEQKIGKLKILAQAYGDVSTSALATAVANDLASGAEIDPEATLSQLIARFGKYKVDMQFSPVEKQASSKASSSSFAAKKEETDWKDLLDKETALLEKQLEANVVTFQEYADRRRGIIEAYYRDGRISAREYYDALEAMYQYQLSSYDKVLKAVTARIDRQVDSLEEEKEAVEKSYRIKIDAIQEEIDALEKANQAKQTQIDLEKAQYELERALNQRTRKLYNGREFIYGSNPDSVRDAQEDLADKEFELHISGLKSQIEALEEEMDHATAVIDSNIEALKAYRDAWNEIPEEWENAQNILLAGQILGADWENEVLSGRLDVINHFRDQYVAAQQAMADAAWQSANEQIKAAQEAQKGASGSAGGGKGTSAGNTSGKAETEIHDISHRSSPISTGIKNTEYSISRSYLSNPVPPKSTNFAANPPSTAPSPSKNPSNMPQKAKKVDLSKLRRYHGGLDEGYVGAGISESERLHIFQETASGRPDQAELKKDEFLAILRKQELVLTPDQQDNILPYLYKSRPSAIIENITQLQPQSFAPPQDISTPVVQNVNLTLPNVTNHSGYEQIKKELFQMQLDAKQFAQRR